MKFFSLAWFPFIFAVAFPVTVYSHNQAAFAAGELWRPVLILLAIAAVLVLSFRKILGSTGLAGVTTSALFIGLWVLGISPQLFLVAVIVIGAAINFRETVNLEKPIPVFNALALGVLALPLLSIYQVHRATDTQTLDSIPFSPFTSLTDTRIAGTPPDIYHIVLDAYAGEDVFNDVLNFDNSNFFESLEDLGFKVNRSIKVPYNETVHTMSSIFLGEYLRLGQYPVDSVVATELRSTLGALIPNSPVHTLLKNNDYTLYYPETGHDFLRFPNDAKLIRTTTDRDRLTRFETLLAASIGLEQFFPSLFQLDEQNPLIRAVKSALSIDYRKYPSPKFVYQHMLAPHTPFTIDRNGDPTSAFPGFSNTTEGDRVVQNDPVKRDLYVAGYLEKLRFLNKRILLQLENIINAPGKKVIFLHGDHGSGSRYWMDRPDLTCLKERFVSFVAVYTDDDELATQFDWLADENTTPINLYRSLFNDLAGTELEPLGVRTSYARYFTPHQIIEFDPALVDADCE